MSGGTFTSLRSGGSGELLHPGDERPRGRDPRRDPRGHETRLEWRRSFVPRLMLPVSLSYDHRVIDGAAAARFIAHLVKVLATCAGLCCDARSASPTSGTSPTFRSSRSSSRRATTVAPEDPLVTLESDKATMDVPAPFRAPSPARVKIGDRVSRGQRAADARGVTDAPRRHNGRRAGDSRGAAAGSSPTAAAASASRRHPRGRPPTAPAAEAQVVVIGAGRGLHRGVPRRRPGSEGPDRALRAARRRLSERRLHPLEGAAACRRAWSPRPRRWPSMDLVR